MDNIHSPEKTECSGDCGCSCGCSGCHHDESHEEHFSFWRPALSFCLLAGGIILNRYEIILSPIVELCWYLCAFLPVGLPVMQEAWESIREKEFFNEFSLMSLASIGAFCIGEYPEAVAVMLFYTVGELLQHRAVEKASGNIRQLLDMRPEQANVLRDGTFQTVSPQTVTIGEIIEVKPGERVPLDGFSMQERAVFDTSALTGESLPRTIPEEGEVLAGMIALNQPVRIRVSKSYDNSALSRILELVQHASEKKARTELFIRRFARIYTPVVVLLAALIIVVPALVPLCLPSFSYLFSDWLYRGLVFLVISCPCALVISVPLGYFAGIGAASRNGILFKGSHALDSISRINAVAFDKTGTLTSGVFEVSSVQTGMPTAEFLQLLASAEQKSNHPVAQAIVRYARKQGIELLPASSIREHNGLGIEAEINGKQVLAGNRLLMQTYRTETPDDLKSHVSTVVIGAVDGAYAGYLLLSDTIKADARQAIKRLEKLGVTDIRMLSGDKKEIVDEVASQLGISKSYGNLLPEDKADYIEQMAAEPGKSTAFVGDGVNDAPVLALSHIGIAMGGLGSDAAIETADVVIQTDQPSKVAAAIAIGRSTRHIIQQNIVFAIGAKMAVLLAGAFGFVSLWAAVFADVGVALLAVLNAVRIFRMKF
ncbi:MAG: cadmium-translocating P-type ATPase [Coprobacter sp.]|nr:cadmium-translocating P-type ATPase [Coprobacter sp.]